eukprot:5516170-Ditylum_brightwellii.AAC.3
MPNAQENTRGYGPLPHMHQKPEKASIIVSQLCQVYQMYKVDPALYLLMNVGITRTPIEQIKNKNPLVPWKNYSKLIESQNRLGWKQIIYGRFSRDWKSHQRWHLAKMDEKHQTDATGWQRHVATTMWKILCLRWKARNSTIHKGNKANSYRVQRQQFLNRIMNLYKEEENVFDQDRRLVALALP